MKKNKHFKRFLLSLYSPVKIFTIIMFVSMMLSQVCNIIKQYIIKNIIDLPSIPNFDIKNLYYIIIILIAIIIMEIIFFYVSNIIRTICIVKRQSPYITQKLFNNLQNKNYKFFTDNYSGKISSAINEIIDETNSLNSVYFNYNSNC